MVLLWYIIYHIISYSIIHHISYHIIYHISSSDTEILTKGITSQKLETLLGRSSNPTSGTPSQILPVSPAKYDFTKLKIRCQQIMQNFCIFVKNTHIGKKPKECWMTKIKCWARDPQRRKLPFHSCPHPSLASVQHQSSCNKVLLFLLLIFIGIVVVFSTADALNVTV